MKRFLSITLTLFMCAITMSAQNFIKHITSNVAGQGTVTVHQDTLIDNIVNGKKQYVPEKKDEKKDIVVPRGKKLKARGYRIQVYWGGSARTEQTNAQRAGARITSVFPELQAYTSFESPNWRCRVGDFATREEAESYLRKINDAKLSKGATIVRSEVFIHSERKEDKGEASSNQ